MLPAKGKARLITQAGPEDGDRSAQRLGRRERGVLQELRAALVLRLLADGSGGAGEAVQGAQEAAVRLVLSREWWKILPGFAPRSGRGTSLGLCHIIRSRIARARQAGDQ
jgi:hypothetical protein